MSQEIELKLALADGAAPRLLTHPLLGGHSPRDSQLRNTYYGTPEATLEAARVALRIRHTPQGLVQTLKTSGRGQGGLSVRGEWEWPIESESLELAGLAELAPLRELSDTALATLAPRFTTDFERHAWMVTSAGSRIEVALDQGEVRADKRRAAIAEVELELKSGEPEALWEMAGQLAECVPLRPASISKAARGAALLAGDWPLPAPHKAPGDAFERAIVALDAEHDSGEGAFRNAARLALASIAAHEVPGDADTVRRLAARLAKRLDDPAWFDLDFGRDALALARCLSSQAM